MDDQMLIKVILDVGMQGGNVKDVVKQFDELTKAQQNQGKAAKETALAESMGLADRLKLKTQMKSLAMEELKSDQDMLKSKATLSKANTDITKSVKELSKEMLHQEKVTRAMGDANAYVEKTFAGVSKGALTLADAEQKLTQNAKAVAQEIMSLKKEMEASGKATGDQVAKLKQLESALNTYKEAADEAGDAQLEFNRMMQNADERLAGNAKAVGMFGASLAGLSGTIGGAGGLLADFAGSAANAANQFGGMMDQLKAGKDMKGFQGMMTQATAAVGMAQVGIQAVMQIYTMIDGAIKKGEQAIIDKGKAATETANQFKSYELGNKTLDDRIKLIDEVAKSDQKMASSLRGLAADSEAFDAKLKQINKSLLETREKGMGKEWEVEQTGGGLFGWMKKIGTATEEMAANMGKARVAIDEFRQSVSQTGKDMEAALTAATSYTSSVDDRIRAMNISIAQNKGDIAEVRRLNIEGLELEKMKTKELIEEKINLIKQREIESKIQASQVRTAVADQQRIINEMTNFRADDSTQMIMNASFKNQKDLAAFMSNMRQILDRNIKYYDDEKTYIKETVAELEYTFGKQFKTAVRRADESVNEFFTNLITGDTDIKNYITSMRELLPALDEVQSGTSLYTKALKDLKDQLDPNNEKSIEKAFDRLIAKQRELWASEDEKNKPNTKAIKNVLDKFAMPQLANMDKEVDYYINLRKTVFEKLGKDFDFGIPHWKKSMDSETKKLAESIAKDNTLQNALKAQQTKLADLEKQLPNLTGAARTEAEKQIQQARGSITTLTEELNNALQKTASIRANIVLSAQEAVKDVANLDSMTAIQKQTKDWQNEIDKIMAGYDKLSDAGKLAAQTQIAAINGVINSLADQSAAMAIAVRKSVEAAKSDNKGLEDLYKKAKEASDAAHDTRTQAQKDEDAYQKKLADTKKYYDDLIEAAKKATNEGGKYATSDIIALEEMRDNAVELIEDTKTLTEETKAYQEQIAKTNEMWSNLSKTVDDASKIHLDWLKIFDPKGYEQATTAMAKTALEAQINGIKGMRDALEKEMIATGDSEAFRNKVKEATKGMLVLTGDKKADWEALWKYFNMTAKEAADLAGYVIDANGNLTKLVATAKEGAIALSGFAAQLKEAGEKANELFNWKPTFDLQGFLTDYDKTMKGVQSNVLETITDKYNSDMKGLNDALDKAIKDANKSFNEWLSNREKGMTDAQKKEFEMSDEYFAKLQENNNKLIELSQDTAEKRLDIAKKNALDLAAAYKTEFDKLEQMQKSFDDRIKSREKMTGDARVEVANYVSRSKMTTAQRDADDLAKGIADQYQKYLAAGMSEVELAEWVALKKKEALTGKDAETTKWFEKQWEERSKAARESARLDKEAFDAETSRMQTALDKQQDLVDKLKSAADAAKNSLIAMLEQLGITAAGIIDATPKAGDTTGEATQKGSSLGSRMQGIKLKDGMLYSQVKNQLADSQKPSAAMIAEIGVAGVTDLEYRNGSWARYRKQAASADTDKPADKPTPKGEAVPLETSAEIQARIDNYNKLGETAKKVITDIKGFVKDYDTAMQESFKLLQPVMTEQWVKDLVASIALLGKKMVEAFKEPFTKEFDPINGTGLVRIIAEWGHTLIQNYGIGIESGIEDLKKSILKTLAEAIQPYLETHSPPEKGALHNIDIWGYQTGQLYTQSFGQGITDGNIYVNDGLTKTADTVQKVNRKIAYEYSPKNLGMATMIGTTDLTALKDVLKQLTANPLVKGMWAAREQEYASSDKEFGAFSKALDLQVNKAEIEKQNSILNITDTAAKVEQFYKQFNKGLLSPDMGDISEELVRKQILDQPYLASFYWYGKQLQQQYPEIYKNLVADGIITPSATGEIKNKAGEIIGRTQTGSYRDRYSVDYQEQDYAGATGFNDWLQSKFNKWLVKNLNMVDPTSGKSISSSGYNPVLARDMFLEGWSDERLADIMTEYQDYVKGLGTVKSFDELQGQLLEKYSGTNLAKSLASGKALDETLMQSMYSDILLTGKDKDIALDKTVVSGGGWYDSSGKEVYDAATLKALMTNGGGGMTGVNWKDILIKRDEAINAGRNAGKIQTFSEKIGSIMGSGWQYGWLESAMAHGAIEAMYLPYSVMKNDEAIEINHSNTQGVMLVPMSETEAIKIYGRYRVEQMHSEGVWPWILLLADREKRIGNYSSIDRDIQSEINAVLRDFKGMKSVQDAKGGYASGAETGTGYTYKNKYTTVKGDYGYGVSKLHQLAGNLDSDKRKLILDNLVARIDEQYPNVTLPAKDQSSIGGGVVSGDYIPVKATETLDYSATRAMLKDKVAQMLGFDKEFSVARGWRNGLDADVENTANEEILKWIELTSDEIRSLTKPTIDDPIVESENYQKTREYLQDLVADKGVTPDLLKDFQTALSAAMNLGYINKSEAANLVSTLLPDGVDIKEQVGLTTFRGGTKEIEGFSWIDALLQSPWGPYPAAPYGQEGMRQLLEKYTDLAPVVTGQRGVYSNKYKITDNAFKYYERATKHWQPGLAWTDLNAPIQIPATELGPMSYTGETPTAYGGGYPIGFDGGMGGFGSYGSYGDYGNFGSPMVPGVNMGTGNRISTFSSGSGNTFYFSVNIAKMDVENGEDFGDQFIEAITDKMKNIGVTI